MTEPQTVARSRRSARASPPPSLQALIFDVDGTLADTEEVHRRAFNRAFQMHGLDWHWSPALYLELLDVAGGQERIGHYLERFSASPTEREELKRQISSIHGTKTRLFAELVESGAVSARPGIARLLTQARAAGVRLAIASTTTLANVESVLEAILGAGALRWFDVIATGNVVRNKKPAPDIYEVALTELGTPPGQAIAFEDSAIGVQAAKAAGLFTVVTPSPWTVTQDFAAADLVLPSLADPDQPLEPPDQLRICARYLGLEQLATIARLPVARTLEATDDRDG